MPFIPEMEFCAFQQVCIVCYDCLRLIGRNVRPTAFAESCVDTPPHSTVQPCVQHGQHMWRQISHIYLAFGFEAFVQDSAHIRLSFAFISPHVANTARMQDLPHGVFGNAFVYVRVYFSLRVDAVWTLGRADCKKLIVGRADCLLPLPIGWGE